MSARRSTAAVFATVLVLATTVGCERTAQSDFWQPGASYEVHLHVEERPSQHPEIPVPPTDSVRVVVTIDSARRDSLYGRYAGALDSIGVFTVDNTLEPLRVAVRVWPDSFAVTLAFLVIDAEVELIGQVRDGVGAGAWRQLSPATPAGRFEVRRISR